MNRHNMYHLKQLFCLLFVSISYAIPATAQLNDLCNSSKQLTLGTLLCKQKNIEAGPDVQNSCGYHNASVWYKFTTISSGNYIIEISDASFNDVLTLFSGTCGNLIERACTNKDEYGFKGEQLIENLSGNTEYHVMVSGADCTFGRTLGQFCLKVRKANQNDNLPTTSGDCSQASQLIFENAGSPSTCILGSTQNASVADPKPSCSLYAGASTWYKLDAGTMGVLKLEVAPNFSQIVTVYSGNCGNMNELLCVMNGESGTGEKTIVNLPDPGLMYYIQVSGNFNSIEADYSSNVNLCDNSDYYIDMSLHPFCLAEYIGTPCDDNNSSTSNDLINANCECVGTCSLAGDRCDDGDPNTLGDVFDMNCNCAGQCAGQGTICDDGNSFTTSDVFDANCNCAGTCLATAPTCSLGYNWNSNSCSCEPSCLINTPCDDENIYTGVGVWDEFCNCVAPCTITCVHENTNVIYLPNEFCKCECFDFGKSCDDGNELTENDQFDISCNCNGTLLEDETGCVELQLNVWLEGAFDPSQGEMSTVLVASRRLLPGQTPISNLVNPTPSGQPYSGTPWNYTGTEGAGWTDSAYTGDETDWVLVSFRTDIQKSTEVAMTAGLLKRDGSISFPDDCALSSSIVSSLYIVIEHRNHMAVMTSQPIDVISNTLTYDFRLADSYREQTSFGQKQIPTGEWVMFAGDADQSDVQSYDVNASDKTLWFNNHGIFDSYLSPDFNLDADVNALDKIFWEENNGISSRVPKQ